MMSSSRAYAGTPVEFNAGGNIFDFVFSNPFQNENAYTPPEHRVAPVRGDQEIFVDEISGAITPCHPLRQHLPIFQQLLNKNKC